MSLGSKKRYPWGVIWSCSADDINYSVDPLRPEEAKWGVSLLPFAWEIGDSRCVRNSIQYSAVDFKIPIASAPYPADKTYISKLTKENIRNANCQ